MLLKILLASFIGWTAAKLTLDNLALQILASIAASLIAIYWPLAKAICRRANHGR